MRLRATVAAWILAGLYLWAGMFFARLATDVVATRQVLFRQQSTSVLRGNTPLFFHGSGDNGDSWFQPVAIYATALVSWIGRDAQVSSAIAGVVAGALNVALVFLIARRVTGRSLPGFAAEIILFVTVSHMGIAVGEIDAIYPITCILLWLYALLRFLQSDSPRALIGAALALGVCVYSHPAGPLTAIFLWMLTLAVSWRRNRVRLLAATLTFIAMWMPAAAWFYLHPETYPDTFGRWVILKAHIRNPLDAVRAFFNLNTLGNRASLYWGFWNPSWLFFGTGAGPAPIWFPVMLLIGVAILRARHISRAALTPLVGAALVVPIAGATFGVPHYLNDAAAVLPLLAIIAALGFDQLVGLLTRRRPLEDDEGAAAVEGWNADDIAPRS